MKRLFCCIVCLCFVSTAFAQDESASIAVLEKLDLSKVTDAELFEVSSVCRSLTRIGTEKSVGVLEKLLGDPRTRDYARTALKSIGGEKAEAALKRHSAKKDNASPVDEKLQKLLTTSLPAILKGDETGLAEFVKLLKSDDLAEFNIALEAFRQFPDRKIVDLLAKEQASLKPERRVAAILSIQDRKDAAPLPSEIFETGTSDADIDVRTAAMAVLGKFFEAKTFPVLFDALADKNDAIAKSAFESLATTRVPEADTEIVRQLENDNPVLRTAACRLAGERRITSSVPSLLKLLNDPKYQIEPVVVYTTLGRIADQAGFARMLDVLVSTDSAEKRSALKEGLLAAGRLATNRTEYVELLSKKFREKPELESIRLELLTAIAGDDALKSIAEIAKTTDKDEVRDQATKILGEWTGAEVAPVLLDLSAALTEPKYKIRTLRGFVRAVRQFEMPKDEKRKLCEKSLGVATRDEEKKMIQEVLDRL